MPSKQSVSPSMTNDSNGLYIGNNTIINPFGHGHTNGMVTKNVTLETNGHGKYDAFRSSTLELNPVENGQENGELKTVDLDLFKDAAAAAFSEFGKSKHEFKSSKLAETNAFLTDAKNDIALNGKVMKDIDVL